MLVRTARCAHKMMIVISGGDLDAKATVNRTMNLGLALQVLALGMLTVPAVVLTVPWVIQQIGQSGICTTSQHDARGRVWHRRRLN